MGKLELYFVIRFVKYTTNLRPLQAFSPPGAVHISGRPLGFQKPQGPYPTWRMRHIVRSGPDVQKVRAFLHSREGLKLRRLWQRPQCLPGYASRPALSES